MTQSTLDADATPVTVANASDARKSPQKLDRQQVSQTLLSGFQGSIKRSRPSVTYLFSALVVAILMVLLPVLYLAVIALVAYGVYYHTIHNTGMLSATVNGRAKAIVLVAYLAPMVCGSIAMVFMIKPLFARGTTHVRTRSLVRDKEPLLFAFVDRICEAVGSPRPRRIDLDCQVNASAMFRRGMISMFGNDLVLTIGLPLIAGLNTRQFAGVLAHEFGHFSQGAGMRLSYIIRSVSFWFARVVYQRDAADEWLMKSAQELDIRLGWVLYLANVFVWATRRLLWVFMQAGNVMGSHLLRQMEFDADRYEIRLAGSEAFVQTCRRLQHLNLAQQAALSDLREFYREGRLGDDLPQLIVARVEQIPPGLIKAIETSIATGTTHWLDTHPSDRDRIEHAYQENAPGVFVVVMPATHLLSDFSAQSKATTWEFYRHIFGDRVDRGKLRPISEVLLKNEQYEASRCALDQFLVGGWSAAEPLQLGSHVCQSPSDPRAAVSRLGEVRTEMGRLASSMGPLYEQLVAAVGELVTAKQLLYCLRAGMKITLDGKRLSARDESQMKSKRDAAEKELAVARRSIELYQRLAAERLSLGLQLFQVPKVVERLGRGHEWAKSLEARLECFRVVGDQLRAFIPIVERSAAFNTFIQQLMANQQDEQVATAVQNLTRELFPLVQRMRTAFQNYKYPYDHANREISLSNFLVPEVPVKDDIASLYQASNQLVESVPALYERLLGDLVLIAVAVETAIGLDKTSSKAEKTAAPPAQH